jgi:glutaconate CoA-transferase subunit B
VEEVLDNTGFDFDRPESVPTTPAPAPATLALLRREVAPQLAAIYPKFAEKVFGIGLPHAV